MRTYALVVVLAASFAVACGDNSAAPDNSRCGDGIVALGEECDDGNTAAGDGCEATCRFTCLASDAARNCTPADACAGQGVCSAAHVCMPGTPLPDGNACGAGGDNVCVSGVCTPSLCGDGIVASSEECDDGNTIAGDGCEQDCRFTCLASDATRNCTPSDACAGQATCSDVTHTCLDSTPLPDGTACGATSNALCNGGVCTSTTCGDGVRDPEEDCDDNNTLNLDGCDSRCKFEQVARVTSLIQQFAPDTFCTKNALGAAIPAVPAVQDFIQQTWTFPVNDGSLSLVFKFLGTLDPTGVRSRFNLGFVDAAPVRFNLQDDGITFEDGYFGSSDLDWWYTLRDPANDASVDPSRTPRVQLAGEVTNGHLTAGPGTIENLRLLFALAPANVRLVNVRIDATFDAKLSKPTVATTSTPPGHLSSERLSPDFVTFESSGISSPLGSMCSDVSAKSLAEAQLGLLALCADPADPTGATPAFPDNHLLDVFVVGCQLFTTDPVTNEPGFVQQVLPTQPDGSLDGSTYVFGVDATTRQVTSCTKDGQPGDLTDCLANATYSSYFKIAADRVILRADMPAILP